MKHLLSLLTIFSLVIISPLTWAEETVSTEKPAQSEYTVGVDDILDINVLQPDKLLAEVTVAPDGTISFPYIGSVMVKGLTLTEIQTEIQARLADGYMRYPVVTVSLRESRSRKFFVYGEVMHPGPYLIDENVTVLRAISMAGGFTKFGSSSKVKLLRADKDKKGYKPVKVNIKAIMNGDSSKDFLVKSGDIITVSEGVF